MSYEAKYICVWCGEHDLSDKEVEQMVGNDIIPPCPKCKKESYCNSIKAKFRVNTEGWRMTIGSME